MVLRMGELGTETAGKGDREGRTGMVFELEMGVENCDVPVPAPSGAVVSNLAPFLLHENTS